MPDRPADPSPKNRFRAVFDWFAGSANSEAPAAPVSGSPIDRALPARLGHYVLTRKLGQGGMGVVYAARDEKLHRSVALKTMSGVAADEAARQRFWREARAAASVSHPHICQIFEIGEDGGELFIAMELLDGAPLSERLTQGPMSVAQTLTIGQQLLDALSTLHAAGIVHRDLKPSNIILMHAPGRIFVKLVDFGLARPALNEGDQETSPALTRAGAVIGTPHYMSPEQALGEVVDARSDLFAAGAILFEMLAGRPAFTGASVLAILHATVYEEPPALSGSPAVTAVDRAIRRALAKKPFDRPASAAAMADELRDISMLGTAETTTPAQPLTRIVVLPFRSLRPDPDTDFLAYSLADAITSSLSSVGSLVVRSSTVAARFASETPDLKTLAVEAGVDRVVMGTLMRSGDELRVSAQLVEAPSGTMVASQMVQMPLGDLFRVQDAIVHRVVEALALPLGAGTGSAPDRPHNARAYELYLRGNEVARVYARLPAARDLYERALALDPEFAPAWAALGRCHRVLGKYFDGPPDSNRRAEDAFRRALALSPNLTLAHKLYAALEAELGDGERAMVRLIEQASRHGNDAELFAGLVHVCRYCGLYEESLLAHAEARRLDPTVTTSYLQTLLMMGATDRIVAATEDSEDPVEEGVRATSLGLAGRRDEARQSVDRMRRSTTQAAIERWSEHLTEWLDRRLASVVERFGRLGNLAIFNDPEILFQEGLLFCDLGDHARGLQFVERAVSRAYFATPALQGFAQFAPLRGTPAFEALLADAEAGRARAHAAFMAAGGDRLLR